MKHDRALAWFAFAIVCLVWGTTYLGIAIAIETVPPVLMTGIRFATAGLILLPIALARGARIPRDAKTLGNLFLIGFLLVGVGNLSVVWAEQWVPSGIAALLVATAPFWMAIIEMFRTKGERVTLRSGIGMLIGFLGVAMLVTPSANGGKWSVPLLLGALAIQIGSFAWQLGSAHGKYNVQHVPLMISAALQMLFGGVTLTIIGLALGDAARTTFTVRTFTAIAYLTIFGSVIAYSAYIYCLSKLRTTTTSLYAYVNPVVAMVLGWLVLNEPLTWVSWLAMGVILGGVALVQSTAWQKAAVTPAAVVAERRAA
jgi:drug/metabolite transporter (DMT)-like permease